MMLSICFTNERGDSCELQDVVQYKLTEGSMTTYKLGSGKLIVGKRNRILYLDSKLPTTFSVESIEQIANLTFD